MQSVLEDLCSGAIAPPTLAAVIQRLRPHADEFERLGIRQLYVYGSVARGEACPRSDVDLFADVADQQRWNIIRWGHALDRLQEILGRQVDFAARLSLPNHVCRRAEAEAIAVFT